MRREERKRGGKVIEGGVEESRVKESTRGVNHRRG